MRIDRAAQRRWSGVAAPARDRRIEIVSGVQRHVRMQSGPPVVLTYVIRPSSSSSSPGEAIAAASGRKARRYSRGMKELVRCQRSVFGSQPSRNRASASARGLLAAASASHADRGLRAMSPFRGLSAESVTAGVHRQHFVDRGAPSA